MKKCRMCVVQIKGRSDKVFCSVACKSEYNIKLKKATNLATIRIDKILHRNRSTLLEIMGKNGTSKKIKRDILDQKKFNYAYITHYHINSQNKFVNYVYDFFWMIFSDQVVLIKKIGNK